MAEYGISSSALTPVSQGKAGCLGYEEMPLKEIMNQSQALKMTDLKSLLKFTIGQSCSSCGDADQKLHQGSADLQHEGLGNDCSHLKRISSGRYKTELCRPFEETGECKYGEKCQFAHGVRELRQLPRHPKYKTELCRTFHTTGFCPYGPRCHFIHKEDPPSKAIVAGLANEKFNDHLLNSFVVKDLGITPSQVDHRDWSSLLKDEVSSRRGMSTENYAQVSLKCPPAVNRETILALAKLINSLNNRNVTVPNPTISTINRMVMNASMRRCAGWSDGRFGAELHPCYTFSQ